jgi:hypothetical protein
VIAGRSSRPQLLSEAFGQGPTDVLQHAEASQAWCQTSGTASRAARDRALCGCGCRSGSSPSQTALGSSTPTLQRRLKGEKRRTLHEEHGECYHADVRHVIDGVLAPPAVRQGRTQGLETGVERIESYGELNQPGRPRSMSHSATPFRHAARALPNLPTPALHVTMRIAAAGGRAWRCVRTRNC